MATQDIIARSATTTPMPSVRQTDQVAKLIDVSECIGCKACQVACSEWNELRDEVGQNHGTYDNPADLTADSWTLMRFAATAAFFGKVTSSTPFSYLACAVASWTGCWRVKAR